MVRQSLIDALIVAKLVALAGTVLPPRLMASDRPVAVARLSPAASRASGGRPVVIRTVEQHARVTSRVAGAGAGRDDEYRLAA